MASTRRLGNRYSLGKHQTAKGAYNSLLRRRHSVEDLAREMAALTIPSVFLPEGFQAGDNIPGAHQSVGAQAVNNLASNLMFMAMPPGRPMLRFEVLDHKLSREDQEADPELRGKVDLGLSLLEQSHRKRAETTSLRSAYTGAMKHLLIAGNVCWDHADIDSPVYHDITRYVVKRDSRGNFLLVIVKATSALASLPEDVRDVVYRKQPSLKGKPEWEQEVDIYRVMRLNTDDETGEKTWCYWEEVEDELIPGTEFEADFDQPPLYPAWLIPVYGQDWGRAYCEEYRGDLYTLENNAEALNDGASIASLSLIFTRPGSRVSPRQIREAANLSVHAGEADDISVFNLAEKMADFNFVANVFENAEKRVERSFLMRYAIQRDAERVTAEEVARLAQALDTAMGGIYSELAQSFQRHVMQRFVALHEEEDAALPAVPEGVVKVGVVTGIDSLGRATEADSLHRIGAGINSTFGPGAAGSILNPLDYGRRLVASEGINPRGLLKTEDDLAEERQQAQRQEVARTLLEKGAGPVAGEVAKGATPAALGALQQQQQQQQTDEDTEA